MAKDKEEGEPNQAANGPTAYVSPEIVDLPRKFKGNGAEPPNTESHGLFEFEPKKHYQNAARVADHLDKRLLFYKNSWYEAGSQSYAEISEDSVRTTVSEILPKAYQGKPPKPVNPSIQNVRSTVEALKSVAFVRDDIIMPTWLCDADYAAEEMLACANGLLHLPTGDLLPLTNDYFSLSATTYAYDPAAPPPSLLFEFLESVWGDDQEAISTLQEWFGYCLMHSTSLQKGLLIIGPRRSGKGTIEKILKRVIGGGCINQTLTALASQFGMQPFIGQKLVVFSDARVSAKADAQAIVEHLLGIIGEDAQLVDRKQRPHWYGQLSTKIMITTNETPRLTDVSGAFASRFIVLSMTKSFLDQEIERIDERICTQLPSILNWAIEGWKRLRERGRFIQPESGRETLEMLCDLNSPIYEFVNTCCTLDPQYQVSRETLYQAYCKWCEEQGKKKPSNAMFGRDLKAAFPLLQGIQPRNAYGQRYRVYVGLKLNPSAHFDEL